MTDDERALLLSLLDLAAATPANVKAMGERVGLKPKDAQAALDGLRESTKPKVPGQRGRRSKLTDETSDKILESVRRGCFLHVAATAAGVDKATLRRWMASDAPHHLAFKAAVDEALASARCEKEAEVFKGEPLAWLRLGPGRTRGDDDPGWTEDVRKLEVKHSGDAAAPLKIEYVNDWKPALVVEDSAVAPVVKSRVNGHTNGTNGNGAAH